MTEADARVHPPKIADERTMLETWLDFHRATLRQKCAGLSDADLRRRSVEPSSMSLLGLVRHLAEVERVWFRRVLAGEDAPALYCSKDHPDGDFDDVDIADVPASFAAWEEECVRARELAAAHDLDAVGQRQRHGEDVSLRWILVHMIEEYARHNGHADFLRERIDGAVGD